LYTISRLLVMSDSVAKISDVIFLTPLEWALLRRLGLDGREWADRDSSLLEESFEVLPAASSDCADGSVAEGSVAEGSVAEGSVAEGSVIDSSVAEGSTDFDSDSVALDEAVRDS
jgi:hypothetical protein